MATQSPSLRFDHREIAVIFMLFIFVSLLMFTVGILVGKGLTQARYEGGNGPVERSLSSAHPSASEKTTATIAPEKALTGTSITTPVEAVVDTPSPAPAAHSPSPEAPATDHALKLIPQKSREVTSPHTLLEPKTSDQSHNILRNPKIQALLEKDPKLTRKLNSLGMPESFASGKFSVQIGSYPSETEASERVASLKKLGFSHAHFSAKALGENQETWYRVWLGYFPDYDGANASGKALKDRGEVKQYLVRKVDSSGQPD